jgi:hypothetical protein
LVFDDTNLYLLGFPSMKKSVPSHILMKLDRDEPRLIGGFGKRIEMNVIKTGTKPRLPTQHWSAKAVIGKRLWLGSPFQTLLDVYDLNGRFVETLKTGVEGMRHEDFDGISGRKDYLELCSRAFQNRSIWRLGPLVIAYFAKNPGTFSATVYDAEGSILSANLPPGHVYASPAAKVIDNEIVLQWLLDRENAAYLPERMGDVGFQKLLETGFESPSDEEALFLIVSRLAPAFRQTKGKAE